MFFYKFRLRRSWYRISWITESMRATWGIICMAVIVSWLWGVEDRFMVSLRQMIHEKLHKYIPIENGGQMFFPFTFIAELGLRVHPRTQWTSPDQKSFFPHSDAFKAKVAVVYNDLDLLSVLLKRDLPSVVDKKTGTTVLGLAASLGRVECVELLARFGMRLDEPDNEGNTPLMLAVNDNQVDVIKSLIKLGARLDLTDNYGYDCCDKAANRGYEHIQEFLEVQEQRERAVNVNPVTPKLEQYGQWFEVKASQLAKAHDPLLMKTGQVYPYFKHTRGFLLYFFGNFNAEQLEVHCSDFAYHNHLDDRGTAEQQLLSFGDAMQGT